MHHKNQQNLGFMQMHNNAIYFFLTSEKRKILNVEERDTIGANKGCKIMCLSILFSRNFSDATPVRCGSKRSNI